MAVGGLDDSGGFLHIIGMHVFPEPLEGNHRNYADVQDNGEHRLTLTKNLPDSLGYLFWVA